MINLKKVYDNINKCLDKLYDYEDYSNHIDLVNEISEQIDLLGAYFGVRMLRKDFGPFQKDEMIYITQDEGGTWMNALDYYDKRSVDLFAFEEKLTEDYFYPIPEPAADVNGILTGKKQLMKLPIE